MVVQGDRHIYHPLTWVPLSPSDSCQGSSQIGMNECAHGSEEETLRWTRRLVGTAESGARHTPRTEWTLVRPPSGLHPNGHTYSPESTSFEKCPARSSLLRHGKLKSTNYTYKYYICNMDNKSPCVAIILVDICNPSPQEGKAGGPEVQGQPCCKTEHQWPWELTKALREGNNRDVKSSFG